MRSVQASQAVHFGPSGNRSQIALGLHRYALDGPDDIRALVVQRNDNTDARRLESYERHQSMCQVVES